MNHVQKVRVLYKTILRMHRGLPVALQELGNNYVKEEFKRHKNCSPMESQKFMSEWAVSYYLPIVLFPGKFYIFPIIFLILTGICDKSC